MPFFCVTDDHLPEETPRLLREACFARGVSYVEVPARTFDYDPARRLAAGDLLFRPGTSPAAMHVELFLFTDGVRTFYRHPDRIYLDTVNPRLMIARAGIPVPDTVLCATSDRTVIDGYVARLGGLPIVANMGSEGGIGILRLDTWPTLRHGHSQHE